MLDSIIIGYNNYNLTEYANKIKSMGLSSGAFKDLNVNYIEHQNQAYYALDILNKFYKEGHNNDKISPFHVFDLLNPAILYLGSFLNRNGFSFDYINLFGQQKEKLRQLLTGQEVLTIAITTTNYVSPEPIREIISFVRECNDQVKIVIGGPYVNYQVQIESDETVQTQFDYLGADFYVINQQGETAYANILSTLKNGGNFDNVDNIAYQKKHENIIHATWVFTKQSKESNPLAENMVDYSLFRPEDVKGVAGMANVRTSVSCPFSCDFCAYPVTAGKYSYLGVDKVQQELNDLADSGGSSIFFIDDTFNVPKGRFKEVLKMMIRNKYNFKWHSFYRCDQGDQETVELMAEAGCEGVFLGIESGSDRILKLMKGTATRKDYARGITELKNAGIGVHANVIIGYPGETYDTAQETINLIQETAPHFFKAQLWYADPITPMWQKREEYGLQGYAYNWSHNTMNVQTAADIIDRMILSIDNSIWSSQYGFVWSLFYLQRRGMDMGQVINFAQSFSQVVREKLLFTEKGNASPQVIKNLRLSSLYDLPEYEQLTNIEIYSGASYKAAEKYVRQEFKKDLPGSAIQTLYEDNESNKADRKEIPVTIKNATLEKLKTLNAPDSHIFLAVFAALLSRINGENEVLIPASFADTQTAIALRIPTEMTTTVQEIVSTISRKKAEADIHSPYVFPILTNSRRLDQLGITSVPTFDVGYLFGEKNVAELVRDHPSLNRGFDLIFQVHHQRGLPQVLFIYNATRIAQTTIEYLCQLMEVIVNDIAKNPDSTLESLTLDNMDVASDKYYGNTDSQEDFEF